MVSKQFAASLKTEVENRVQDFAIELANLELKNVLKESPLHFIHLGNIKNSDIRNAEAFRMVDEICKIKDYHLKTRGYFSDGTDSTPDAAIVVDVSRGYTKSLNAEYNRAVIAAIEEKVTEFLAELPKKIAINPIKDSPFVILDLGIATKEQIQQTKAFKLVDAFCKTNNRRISVSSYKKISDGTSPNADISINVSEVYKKPLYLKALEKVFSS